MFDAAPSTADARTAFDPLDGPDEEIVKPIQPYQARKTYLCPGCEGEIEPGVGHLVVVPSESLDLRRHWHRGCWHKECRRRGDHRIEASDRVT